MKISLQNAVKGLCEFLSDEFSKNDDPKLMDIFVPFYAEYKLQTQGLKILKTFDNGDGYINIDVMDALLHKYTGNMPDKTIKTLVGDITVTGDTPQQIMQYLKKYGEN